MEGHFLLNLIKKRNLKTNYTPYEGLNLANEQSRKLGGSSPTCVIIILINIRENEAISFK